MTTERSSPGGQRLLEGHVIPFGGTFRRLQADVVSARVTGRTIRPMDVVMLLPLIVPLVAAILLGLLGWFVAWLATVAALVAAIVFRDIMRGLWRRNRRALDRQVVG
jgi:hypothetical protein